MGKIYSVLTRPIRLFNIENRAQKVISQKKPIPAPQYPIVEKQRELADKVNPHFLENHYQKNVQLDKRLKDVFVTSKDPQEIKEPTQESKSLPQNRHSWENNFLYDPYEFTVISTPGKCSLKQALTFIMQHKFDPITYSSENIASEYKIDKKVIDDILKYYKTYVTVSKSNSPEALRDSVQDMIDFGMKMKEKAKK